MPRYMIQADHTLEDCMRVLDGVLQAGAHYLASADWGCEAGVHTGWLVVEARDDHDAALMAPPVLRKDARVVRLNRFTPGQVREFHNRKKQQLAALPDLTAKPDSAVLAAPPARRG